MNVGSLVVNVGSLAVAFLSVYLSYKSRTSSYRELLYSKQLEGYVVVVDALQKVNETALNFIGQKNWRLDEVSRPGLRQAVLNHILAFQTVQQSWAIFLPRENE